MGNSLRCCLACVLPCGALDLIRIVHLSGYVEEIARAVTAGEILKDYPNHVLSKPCSQGMVRKILILSPGTELKRGSIYFLIPHSSLPSDQDHHHHHRHRNHHHHHHHHHHHLSKSKADPLSSSTATTTTKIKTHNLDHDHNHHKTKEVDGSVDLSTLNHDQDNMNAVVCEAKSKSKSKSGSVRHQLSLIHI